MKGVSLPGSQRAQQPSTFSKSGTTGSTECYFLESRTSCSPFFLHTWSPLCLALHQLLSSSALVFRSPLSPPLPASTVSFYRTTLKDEAALSKMRPLTQFDGLHLEKLSYPNQISHGDQLQLLSYSLGLDHGGEGSPSDPSNCFGSRVNIHEPSPVCPSYPARGHATARRRHNLPMKFNREWKTLVKSSSISCCPGRLGKARN